MKTRSRFVPLLAAALLLGAALALRFFWSTPELEPSAAGERPSVKASRAEAPAPVAPAAAPVKPEPVKAEAPAQVAEVRAATVVPLGPGDEVPEIPPEVVSSEPNDPILPEKPQTAAWKHQKTVRITELLDRDVERLEGERKAAEARGDAEEARRLEVQLARHRARLGKLREESAALAEAARDEPAE
jgi:hypothetical protein